MYSLVQAGRRKEVEVLKVRIGQIDEISEDQTSEEELNRVSSTRPEIQKLIQERINCTHNLQRLESFLRSDAKERDIADEYDEYIKAVKNLEQKWMEKQHELHKLEEEVCKLKKHVEEDERELQFV